MSEDEITLIRSDIRGLCGTIDSLDRAVRGDDDTPGLLADVRGINARLVVHDRRAWAIRWLGSPLLGALSAVIVWGAAQVWAQYTERNAELRSNTVAVAVIKERLDGLGAE